MKELQILSHTLQKMVDYGNSCPTEEVCGMLLGIKKEKNIWEAVKFVKITNVDESTNFKHYRFHPEEFLSTLLLTTHADNNAEIDFVGIFHTHPDNRAIPSIFDIEGAGYNVFFPIYSPAYDELSIHFCEKIKQPWIKSKLTLI